MFKNTTTLLNFLGICLNASNIAISRNECNNSEFRRANSSSEVRHEALGQFPSMFEAPSNNTSRYRTLCFTWTRIVNQKVHVTEYDDREQLSFRFIFPCRERVKGNVCDHVNLLPIFV